MVGVRGGWLASSLHTLQNDTAKPLCILLKQTTYSEKIFSIQLCDRKHETLPSCVVSGADHSLYSQKSSSKRTRGAQPTVGRPLSVGPVRKAGTGGGLINRRTSPPYLHSLLHGSTCSTNLESFFQASFPPSCQTPAVPSPDSDSISPIRVCGSSTGLGCWFALVLEWQPRQRPGRAAVGVSDKLLYRRQSSL